MRFPGFFPILFVFILALFMRAFFLFTYDGSRMLREEIRGSDETVYNEIAVNITKSKGCVIGNIYARRMPLYPMFLASVYYFSGNSLVAARFVQSLIGALICVLIYLLGAELLSNLCGFIAGLISAVYYSFVQLSAYIISETLYILLFVMSILFVLYYFRLNKIRYLILSAVSVGLTTLCRESGFFLIPLTGIFLLLAGKNSLARKLKDIAVFVFLSLAIVSVWSVRNYFHYRQLIPFTISSGHSLYIGNNELTVAYNGGDDTPSIFAAQINNLFTPETDSFLRNKAVDFIVNNPVKVAKLSFNKFVNMWQPYFLHASLMSKVVMVISYVPVLLLGIAGIICSFKKDKFVFLSLGVILLYSLLHMFTISGIRYRYPLMPIFIIYASLFLCRSFFKQSNQFPKDKNGCC